MAKTRHSEQSEKSIERYLTRRAAEAGAKALKYYNPVSTGWPDRVVLFRGGLVAWVELKSRGEKPRPLQAHRHAALRDMGHRVYTCDSRSAVDAMIERETRRAAGAMRALAAAGHSHNDREESHEV